MVNVYDNTIPGKICRDLILLFVLLLESKCKNNFENLFKLIFISKSEEHL